MRLPFEVVEAYIATPLKAMVAKRLWERGYSQMSISKILGISQPTVNSYVRSPRYSEERIMSRVARAGIGGEEFLSLLDRVVSLVEEGRRQEALSAAMEFSLKALSELRLCEIHRIHDPRIPLDCRICSDMIQIASGASALRALETAYDHLLRERCLYKLVPEVYMNIAFARENPSSLADVAAFPGRIVRVGRSIATVSRPAWGASRHLGRILLKISGRRSLRSLANIKPLKCVEESLKRLGIPYRTLGPRGFYVSEDDIVEQVSEALSQPGVEVVIDLGGIGMEPVAYIGGRDPLEVASRISQISRMCSESLGEC